MLKLIQHLCLSLSPSLSFIFIYNKLILLELCYCTQMQIKPIPGKGSSIFHNHKIDSSDLQLCVLKIQPIIIKVILKSDQNTASV